MKKFDLVGHSLEWNDYVSGFVVTNNERQAEANLQYSGEAYGDYWGFGLDGGYISEGFSDENCELVQEAFEKMMRNEDFAIQVWQKHKAAQEFLKNL